MAISKLRIKDFQVIEHADFNLGRITAIIGASMSGKSSVMRALRNLSSAATGHSFVRAGRQKCAVVIQVDGRVIGWSKGKATNKYMLDRQPFDKIGRDVPGMIDELLGFCTLVVKDKKLMLNIQQQLDPPFMVGEVGSTISEMLGTAIGYDKLVLAVTKVATKISQLQSSESVVEALLSEAQVKLTYLFEVPDLVERARQLDREKVELRSEENEFRLIEERIEQAKEHRRCIKVITPVVAFLKELREFALGYDELCQLETLMTSAAKLENEIIILTEMSEFVVQVELLARDEQKYRQYEAMVERGSEFERSIGRIESNMVALLRETPIQVMRKMKEIWPKLQGSPCPVCGRAMDAGCLDQLRGYVNERLEALAVDGGV